MAESVKHQTLDLSAGHDLTKAVRGVCVCVWVGVHS